MPLLQARGINLSESQVYRLVTGTPERIPARTFAALCDILDCTPGDLFEPYVEMRAGATANAPKRSEDIGVPYALRDGVGRCPEIDEASQQRTHLDPPEARDPVPANTRGDAARDPPGHGCPAVLTHPRVRPRSPRRTRRLPQRDALRARHDDWARQALDRIADPASRDVINRYVRWHHQRRMKQVDQVSQGTFLRSKQTVSVAIDFLNWLTDHGIEFAELEQEHLDAWQATGPTTRLIADRFLRWAIKNRIVRPELAIQRHRRGTSPRRSAVDRERVVQRVVHGDEMTARDRAAAILVFVFGQQIEDVVGLTWDDVKVIGELVTVRVGAIEIALPEPLDEPWRQLASSPGHDLTAAHPNSNWVFRGHSPSRHLDPGHPRTRLRYVFSTRAARLGTLHELTKLAPGAILAEALGYSPATTERHSVDSATAYACYVAAISDQRVRDPRSSPSPPKHGMAARTGHPTGNLHRTGLSGRSRDDLLRDPRSHR